MAVIRQPIPEVVIPGRRLGRHIHFDTRSLAYPAPEKDTATLSSVRHARQIPVLDQGNVGSCTGNAMVGALGTDPDWSDLAGGRPVLDERLALSIYSQAELLDGDGPYPPNDNGSSGTSVASVAKKLGWIAGYTNALTLAAALTALEAGPVLLGMLWKTGCDTPNKVGRINYVGQVRGGHEIVLDELDVTNQLVWLTNSWGTSWGLNGRACLSWSDLGAILADQGDVIAPVPLTQPAPVPTPAPTPAPVPGGPSDADRALWATVQPWTLARHVGSNKAAATAVATWAKASGLS